MTYHSNKSTCRICGNEFELCEYLIPEIQTLCKKCLEIECDKIKPTREQIHQYYEDCRSWKEQAAKDGFDQNV